MKTEKFADKVELVLQIHDELLFIIDKSIVDEFAKTLRHNIKKALKQYIPGLRLSFPVRFEEGPSWAELGEAK